MSDWSLEAWDSLGKETWAWENGHMGYGTWESGHLGILGYGDMVFYESMSL